MTNPGLYYEMPNEEYYSSPALGASKLKAFAESPLHYKMYEDFKDTPALAFGRAAHTYILEGPSVFESQYVVMPEGMQRRGKEYNALLVGAKDRTVIKPDDFEHIKKMREQLMRSDARKYLEAQGRVEVSIFWEHDGIKCRGRLDKLILQEAIGSATDLVLDYKTCTIASIKKCMRAMEDYKYWAQEAHYGTGYHRLTDRDSEMLFIFQEKTPPYDICLVRMSDDASPIAYQKYNVLMKDLGDCISANNFPGRNVGKGIAEWGFFE